MKRIDRNRVRGLMEPPVILTASDKEFVESVKGELSAYAVSVLLPKPAPKKEEPKKATKKATKKKAKKSKK